MAKVYDVTNWAKHPWLNTGGTRDKKYVQSPDGEYYYFKTSLHRINRDYKFEFWNEIIAFRVGKMLGFKVLRYDIGIDDKSIGCISKSMIDNDIEDLNEGGKYLQAFDNTFDPDKKETRNQYSFQLIEHTLINFKLEQYINEILEIIVFDSIIGNGDRHQENWAFIIELNSVMTISIAYIDRLIKHQYDEVPRFIRWLLKPYKDKKEKKIKKQFQDVQISLSRPREFAPIYDNGSSLAREIREDKIHLYNTDDKKLTRYILSGKPEIHWNNEKVDHFTLLQQISKYKYSKELQNIIKRVISKYDSNILRSILDEVDKNLDDKYSSVRLSKERKSLIYKIIDLRIKKLGELDL